MEEADRQSMTGYIHGTCDMPDTALSSTNTFSPSLTHLPPSGTTTMSPFTDKNMGHRGVRHLPAVSLAAEEVPAWHRGLSQGPALSRCTILPAPSTNEAQMCVKAAPRAEGTREERGRTEVSESGAQGTSRHSPGRGPGGPFR